MEKIEIKKRIKEIEARISEIEAEYRALEKSITPQIYTEKRRIQSYEWDEDTGYSIPVTQPYEVVEEIRVWHESEIVKKQKQKLIAEKKQLLLELEQLEDKEAEYRSQEILKEGFYEVMNPYESTKTKFKIPEQIDEALFFVKVLGFPRAEWMSLKIIKNKRR